MKTAARLEAISLRRQGRGVKEIARKVKVSQSTASRWCSSVSISAEQRTKLDMKRRQAGMKALAPWIKKNRELKNDDIKQQGVRGRRDIGRMTKRDLCMLGIGLYWGEGYKRGSQEWGFTNSDPAMIRCVLLWLRSLYDVSPGRVIARLTINKRYRDQTERLTRQWARETGIHQSQFRTPTYIQGYNASKLNGSTYRGTLRIKVSKGTSLRRRILASITEINGQIALSSRKTFS